MNQIDMSAWSADWMWVTKRQYRSPAQRDLEGIKLLGYGPGQQACSTPDGTALAPAAPQDAFIAG